jgi:hypothetical protein
MVGENNPYWIMAEPMLLKIWADGILRTPSLNLHFANVFSLIVNMIFFSGGVALRPAAVMAALLLGYFAFPRTLFVAFETIVDTDFEASGINNLWLYRLLALAILIKVSLFLFNGFTVFARDLLIYLALMLTNMTPLRIIAKGLQNERYFAQCIAKTSFMGTYIVQTMTATPFENQGKWDRVFNLYMNSNQPSAREQLEHLSDEYSSALVRTK